MAYLYLVVLIFFWWSNNSIVSVDALPDTYKKKTLSASIFYGLVGDHVLVQNMVEAYLSLD